MNRMKFKTLSLFLAISFAAVSLTANVSLCAFAGDTGVTADEGENGQIADNEGAPTESGEEGEPVKDDDDDKGGNDDNGNSGEGEDDSPKPVEDIPDEESPGGEAPEEIEPVNEVQPVKEGSEEIPPEGEAHQEDDENKEKEDKEKEDKEERTSSMNEIQLYFDDNRDESYTVTLDENGDFSAIDFFQGYADRRALEIDELYPVAEVDYPNIGSENSSIAELFMEDEARRIRIYTGDAVIITVPFYMRTIDGLYRGSEDGSSRPEFFKVHINDNRSFKKQIAVSINSINIKYDGKSHKIDEEQELLMIGTEDYSGYTVTAQIESKKIKDVGSTEIVLSDADDNEIRIYDETGEDVSEQFQIDEVISGTLTVGKRELILTSATAGKIYDGEDLIKESVIVGGDGYAEGETAKINMSGRQRAVGSSSNTFSVENNGDFNVDNYNIITRYGSLTVTDNLSDTREINKKEKEEVDIRTHYNVNGKGDSSGSSGSSSGRSSGSSSSKINEVEDWEAPNDGKYDPEDSAVLGERKEPERIEKNITDLTGQKFEKSEGYTRSQTGTQFEVLDDAEKPAIDDKVEGISEEIEEAELVKSEVLGETVPPERCPWYVMTLILIYAAYTMVRACARHSLITELDGSAEYKRRNRRRRY